MWKDCTFLSRKNIFWENVKFLAVILVFGLEKSLEGVWITDGDQFPKWYFLCCHISVLFTRLKEWFFEKITFKMVEMIDLPAREDNDEEYYFKNNANLNNVNVNNKRRNKRRRRRGVRSQFPVWKLSWEFWTILIPHSFWRPCPNGILLALRRRPRDLLKDEMIQYVREGEREMIPINGGSSKDVCQTISFERRCLKDMSVIWQHPTELLIGGFHYGCRILHLPDFHHC